MGTTISNTVAVFCCCLLQETMKKNLKQNFTNQEKPAMKKCLTIQNVHISISALQLSLKPFFNILPQFNIINVVLSSAPVSFMTSLSLAALMIWKLLNTRLNQWLFSHLRKRLEQNVRVSCV